MKNSLYLLLPIFIAAACNKSQNQPKASGVFEAQEIIISAETAGKILTLDINEGDELKAGTLVGGIDCENVSLQKAQVAASIEALAAKQNSAGPQVQILRETLNAQQKQLGVQNQQLSVLEKEQQRIENLVKAEAVPSKQLDDINGQIAILKRQIEATQSQLGITKQQIKSQEAQVAIGNRAIMSEQKPLQEKMAQMDNMIGKCGILNPTNGTVLTKYAEANEMTAPGKALYKIADLTTMTLRAYVSGSQLGELKLNQQVKVSIDNGESAMKTLNGTLVWIADKAEFTPKTIQTKDERANLVYAIKIKVKNDGYIKLGMYGEIAW